MCHHVSEFGAFESLLQNWVTELGSFPCSKVSDVQKHSVSASRFHQLIRVYCREISLTPRNAVWGMDYLISPSDVAFSAQCSDTIRNGSVGSLLMRTDVLLLSPISGFSLAAEEHSSLDPSALKSSSKLLSLKDGQKCSKCPQ